MNKTDIEAVYGLSPIQQGILFHCLQEPESGLYVLQYVFRLSGELDLENFRRAWQTACDRHSIIRTAFTWKRLTKMHQVVLRQVLLPVEVIDWREHSAVACEAKLQEYLLSDQYKEFDFTAAPLMRLVLFRLADDSYQFVCSFHHLILDGWSYALLLREVTGYYQSFVTGTEFKPPKFVPYREYIEWLKTQNIEDAKSFWTETLKGITEPTPFPLEPTGALPEKRQHSIHLSREKTTALQKFAQTHHLTLNTIIQGAWALLLSLYTGSKDVVFGATVSGRSPEISDIESMIGLFITSLPVRVRIDNSDRVVQWLQVQQDIQARSREYDYAPLVDIHSWSEIPRSLPLFETLVGFQNYPAEMFGTDSPAATTRNSEQLRTQLLNSTFKNSYPLTLTIHAQNELTLQLDYDISRCDHESIEKMLAHLQTIVERLAANPQGRLVDVRQLDLKEQHHLIAELNRTAVDYDLDRCIHELVTEQALRTPDRIAVVFESTQLSYRELHVRSNQLAHHLLNVGVTPDMTVAICAERSPEIVVAMLAVLKTGAAYLPIDPGYPAERVAYVLDEARTPVLVTQERLREKLPATWAQVVCVDDDWAEIEKQSKDDPQVRVANENLAYVIYTSGSTGQPKGVMVRQQGLINHMHWMAEEFGLSSEDCILQKTPVSFDASVWEFYAALMYGGRLVLGREGGHQDAGYLVAEMLREGVTLVQVVPTMLQWLVTEAGLRECASVRAVFCGGEALRWEAGRLLGEQLGAVEWVNLYGPTEGTIEVTWWRGKAGAGTANAGAVPIGRPIANTEVYVVDEAQQVLPVGVYGELCIGGVGLARGYLNRPELTAERFVPHPYSATGGARLYRTGDVVRWNGEGQLEFRGRADHQVKVRGYRIELGEIEAALRSCSGVKQAVVLAREQGLVGYVVSEGRVSNSELRAQLSEKLPQYMVPAVIVELTELPLTASGKLDRKALPEPELSGREQEYAGPRTPVEELLAGIFAEVLKLERVGRDENFFELGGHSLLATQVVSRVQLAFGVELPLRTLFEAPTVAGLAVQLEQLRRDGGAVTAPALEAVERSGKLPLSFAQQRLWFIDQLEPESVAYNIPAAVRLRGKLNVEALRRSFTEIVRRHEVLRTRFVTEAGEPQQVIGAGWEVELPVLELSELPETERETAAREWAAKEAAQPFVLSEGPLLRLGLARLSEEEHVLAVTMHHIISDGWSVGVLIREVSALYEAYSRGEESPLSELAVQYGDFAVWQREWLQGAVLEQQLSYWREQLAGLAPLELPTDYPRPPAISYRGKSVQFVVPSQLLTQLRELSHKETATLYMTVLAAFQLLLSRYSQQEDVAVGTAIANRNHRATEPLIGFFVNQLVMRTSFAGDPRFADLLKRVLDVTLNAFANQDLPFERIVEELTNERDLGRAPLFQVMFALQNAPVEELSFSGLKLDHFDFAYGKTQFDLTFVLAEHHAALEGVIEYASDLFEHETVERLANHFLILLDKISQTPQLRAGEVSFLTASEEQQLLSDWNDTRRTSVQNWSLPLLFSEQASLTPDRIALVYENQMLTYRQLELKTDQLARYLSKRGVRNETRVAILLERSIDLYVVLLAILKAGGAYVPLDPGSPPDRLSFILNDTDAVLLITTTPLLDHLPDETPETILMDSEYLAAAEETDAAVNSAGDNLAYIMYTSGSTGRPKGVAVSHRNIVRLVKEQNFFEVGPSDRFFQFAPVSFDASTFEIWGCLLNGACLVIAPAQLPSLNELGGWLEKFSISVLWLTSSLFHKMAEEQLESMSSVRRLLAGGEVVSAVILEKAIRDLHCCEFVNGYGPTENTTFTACFKANSTTRLGASVPIGKPINNTQVYVVDHAGNLAPVNVWGELYAGGLGLSRGYFGRPDFTAERFIPDPFSGEPGARLYQTGDRARWRNNGTLEFDKRLDEQIKLRGFRIEPGEIEAALLTYPHLRQAAVIAHEFEPGDKRIIAYVIADGTIDTRQLQRHLQTYLPEYMCPAAIVPLSEFPLTSNGKLDRRMLPLPEQLNEEDSSHLISPVAEILLGMFRQILRNSGIGIDDGFFEMGGHSMLATQVMSRIHATFKVDLPVRVLFESPTVAGLSERVGEAMSNDNDLARPPIERRTQDGPIPLSFAQQRLWFMDQLNPGSIAYNVPLAVRFNGQLSVVTLEKCLTEIVRRHEILRTRFITDKGEPCQVVAPARAVKIPVVDLSSVPEREKPARVSAVIGEVEATSFDLSSDRLFRPLLLQLDHDEFILAFTMHHIISDAWSLGILIREFETLYNCYNSGQESTLPELELQYADFALWQRNWLRGGVLKHHLEYWKQKLAGVRPLELPADYPRSHNGDAASQARFIAFNTTWEVSARIRSLAQAEGVTVFMLLLAAFQLLLGRTAGRDDVAVGTSIANRNLMDTEGLIGFFVNEIVLRTDLRSATNFRSLLRQVRQTVLEAYTYQDMPFDRLVEELAPARVSGRSPLFDVLFVVHNTPESSVSLSDLEMNAIPSAEASSKFDLTLFMNEGENQIAGELHFDCSLFQTATIERFIERFQRMLEEVTTDPDRPLSLVSLIGSIEADNLVANFSGAWDVAEI